MSFLLRHQSQPFATTGFANRRAAWLLAFVGVLLLVAPHLPGRAQSNEASAAARQAPASGAPVRASLLPLVQPLWSELKPEHQRILEPISGQWNTLSIVEKKSWIGLASRYPGLPATEKERINERLRQWAALTPEQRRLARQNYRLAKAAPPEERSAQSQQYQTLTEEQKKVLQQNGSTSNTAARHAGARTALAKEAEQPLSEAVVPTGRSPAARGSASSLAPTR